MLAAGAVRWLAPPDRTAVPARPHPRLAQHRAPPPLQPGLATDLAPQLARIHINVLDQLLVLK